MFKYQPLREFLSRQLADRVERSFEQLRDEDIIGIELPESAYTHVQWWSNEHSEVTRHVQCRAWLDAGWRVDSVDLAAQRVTFVRVSYAKTHA